MQVSVTIFSFRVWDLLRFRVSDVPVSLICCFIGSLREGGSSGEGFREPKGAPREN